MTPKREPSHTKSGPGRKHKQGDGKKTAKQLAAGSFGRGLRNVITRKNRDAIEVRAAFHEMARKAAKVPA